MTEHKEVERIEDIMFKYFQDSVNPEHIKECAKLLSKTSGVGEIKKVLNMCLSIVEAGNHFDSESIDKLRALTERINNEYN